MLGINILNSLNKNNQPLLLMMTKSLMLMLPIFISITTSFEINMTRYARSINLYDEYGNLIFDTDSRFIDYIATAPLSLIVVGFILLINIRKIVGLLEKRYELFFLLYLFLTIVLNIIFSSISFAHIKVVIGASLFVVLLCFFDEYFKDIKNRYPDIAVHRLEQFVLFYPLLTVVSLVVISRLYLGDSYFLTREIVIYNWLQYFSFVSLVLVAQLKNVSILSLIVFCLALYCVKASDNSAAEVILYLYILIKFVQFIVNKLKSNFPFGAFVIYGALFSSFFVMSITYMLFIAGERYLSSSFYEYSFALSIKRRQEIWGDYLSSMEWYELIFPLHMNPSIFSHGLHNEILHLSATIGLLGVIVLYSIVLKRLLAPAFNENVVIMISLIVFVGGIMALNLLHPYMLILIAYFLSFHYIFGRQNTKLL